MNGSCSWRVNSSTSASLYPVSPPDNTITLPTEVFSSCLAIVSAVMVGGLFLWPVLRHGTGYQTVWETRPSAETPSNVYWRCFYFQLTCVHSALELSGRIYLLTYLLKRCVLRQQVGLSKFSVQTWVTWWTSALHQTYHCRSAFCTQSSLAWVYSVAVNIISLLHQFWFSCSSHVHRSPVWGRGTHLPPLSIYFLIFSPFYFSLSFIGFTCFLLLSIPSLSTRIDGLWCFVLFGLV